MKKSILTLLFILNSLTAFAETTIVTTKLSETGNQLYSGIIVALITAILSFIIAYFFYIKKLKEQKKQLSYDLEIKNGLVEVENFIKKDISIKYKGQSTENLHHVLCYVQNTGNKVIKNQQIRFNFTSDNRIATHFFDSPPLPELNISIQNESENELIYQIGHIEKGQRIGFGFIISGKDVNINNINIYPFNDEGDIEFLAKSIAKIYGEKEIILQFIVISAVLIFIPDIINSLFRMIFYERFVSFISAIFKLILFLGWLKYLNKTTKILIDFLFQKKEGTINIDTTHNQGGIFINNSGIVETGIGKDKVIENKRHDA